MTRFSPTRPLASRALARLAAGEQGFGLIELLIAMTVTVIAIMALVAGLSSGMVALNRASSASTAATLADRQMETYRQGSFAAVPTTTLSPPTPPGYSMQVDGSWSCPTGGTPPTCSGTPASHAVKLVTIVVSSTTPVKELFRESSTFDQATG